DGAANLISGGGGNDTLDGGLGSDTLDGGSGSDTASFAGASSGVKVNLGLSGAQDTGGGGIKTLVSIENIAGSPYSDTLEGASGVNVMSGGGGVDTLTYAHAGAGVTVNLMLTSAQNTGGAGIDTISGFTNLAGSSFDDVLRAG